MRKNSFLILGQNSFPLFLIVFPLRIIKKLVGTIRAWYMETNWNNWNNKFTN